MSSQISAIATLSILTFIYATTVMGDNITVDDDGLADHQSIQMAIDSAREGDRIQVAAGTYMGHIRINKSNIALQGAGHNLD